MQKPGQSGHRKADKHMKISYNVTGSKRKELVQAISRELKTEAKYCGAPGFTYEVGGLRIDRDGTVSGPDNRGLIADLEGLYSLVPTEKAYETAGISATPSDESDLEPRYTEEELGLGLHHCDPIGENGMQTDDAPDVDESDILAVEFPLAGFTPQTLDNLTKMVAAKEAFIKAALGSADLPIQVTEETVSFPWFTLNDPSEVACYTQFIAAICKTAMAKKRVTAKDRGLIGNPKYAMRCWLLSLGLIGSEFKNARKQLLAKLEGNSSFKGGVRPA